MGCTLQNRIYFKAQQKDKRDIKNKKEVINKYMK